MKEKAEKWSTIDIPLENSKHFFTKVNLKIKDSEISFGRAHFSCRTTFATKIESFKRKFGLKSATTEGAEDSDEKCQNTGVLRRSVSQYLVEKKLCFVCNEKRVLDENAFKEGGLARCTEEDCLSGKKRIQKMTDILSTLLPTVCSWLLAGKPMIYLPRTYFTINLVI